MRVTLSHAVRQVEAIRAGPMTFRTLHPPPRYDGPNPAAEYTLDALITVMMPAISGLHHIIKTTRIVKL